MRNRDNPRAWADTLPSQFGPYPPPSAPAEAAQAAAAAHTAAVPPQPQQPARLPFLRWLAEGLRAALLRAPRTGAATPTPWQLLALVLLNAALLVGAARALVPGPANFYPQGWLVPQWTTLALLWCAWWAMAPAQHRARAPAQYRGALAAWFVLTQWAALPAVALLYALSGWAAWRPGFWAGGRWPWVFWGGYALLMLWWLAALSVLAGRFIRSWRRTAVFALALVALIGAAAWQSPDAQPWVPAVEESAAGEPEPPRLHLSQSLFEAQQALWARQMQALAPQRDGVVDVYGLVFAPYAGEDVFRRESTLVATLLQERFDAQGRVLHLLNHAETAATHPWATPQNLQRAVAALGARMDRDKDVLVVYMTSHGARSHELAASHWPLEVPPVTPEMLRAALDGAGIRHRVIAISACYSGGWVEPLANDDTLVMTAADATHTSYGCGSRSELTFFGRAVFDEQLRQTHSFTEAFARAVPVIQQREVEAGKADGFSNPQIRVGAGIAPVLKALEERLANP